MSKLNIIRAWKDEEYRRGLSDAERACLPGNPAGAVDLTALSEAEMAAANGGMMHSTDRRGGACSVAWPVYCGS
jgi:mersacidin/lichenicidin family type 2 lantibiotic